ncbi:MAG TPA: [Fe-Fe] hydrogenase large subunit C-terminal domain-containing protein [Bacteroidales bacterium]|jgi:iron only hydrogenase large subunit-like protein|nr:[Fe-Fe] hydrogenase large subunit C-terminal domain-containing protein [Bacteroidales bacterium]NLD64494.1 4Fe-4S binding protein [Bacteroidales bacterium]HNT92482.1 [Fe-Fe] hydrogenase large subunit C-terminal domain-containing protein [Bacteroidales bacterium]HOO65313.1 [Fe-Fe] hydrogenase large subunit C-terminal domain-containing protein [Bacteroidales bacterium]HPE21445.1 [Fe-Fe] hydrogenase large subunit C-terminal domain-containing protein [Bacteroidales bacterium]
MKIPDQVIYINEDKCRNSYSCVRACPVNAIEVKPERAHPVIIADRCIGCGLCYLACSPGAIEFMDSKGRVKEILQSGRPAAALVAPSIASEFDDITDYRKFVAMIRKLGFTHVHEVSFGVDLVAYAYKKLFEESSGKYYITANCPSIVEMIEKYHPHLVPNLAPLVSPTIATAMVTRDLYGEEVANVFIGPCIDIKAEADLYSDRNLVEGVLTFIEIRQLFEENNIQEKTVKMSEFDPPFGNWGALYPYPAGILQAAGIKRDLVSSHVITASGAEDVKEAINDFDHHIDTIRHHFNLFFCPGCMLGPGMIRHDERYRRRSLVKQYAEKRVEALDKKQWQKDMDRWSKLDLTRTFRANDQRIPEPSPESIGEVLKIIGKDNRSEELNCNACGYGSCREFASTVAKGLAVPEMCHTYNLRNKQEYIETLRQTNRKLSETKKALKESEEQAMREKDAAQDASDTMNSMLNKLPNGVVIVDNELKILHSNERFLEIIGEDAKAIAEIIPGLRGADLKTLMPFNVYNIFSFVLRENESVISRDVQLEDRMFNVSIFPIRQNRIAGAVIRDLFSPEVQREEVISRVSDVIDKNLDMVQKIGFLLGEGASETEKMLNSIVESFRQKKNEPGK